MEEIVTFPQKKMASTEQAEPNNSTQASLSEDVMWGQVQHWLVPCAAQMPCTADISDACSKG